MTRQLRHNSVLAVTAAGHTQFILVAGKLEKVDQCHFTSGYFTRGLADY